jgi:phosphotransferase system HPr-like phosphotransfer protein
MFRKIVNILGILSLLVVLGAGGTAAYLAIRGTLTGSSVRAAVAALTSQPAPEDAASSQPAAASRPTIRNAGALHGPGQEGEAAIMGELEMLRRQVANERAMAEAARLEVLRERERMEQQRKQWEASRQEELESSQQSGVQKELEYLASIKPAQSLMLLRGKADAEAARVLMAMETRKGKKIIELCKTPDEQQWCKRILELIRERNNVQAAALAGG